MFPHLFYTSHALVFSSYVYIFESCNLVLFFLWKLNLNLFLHLCSNFFCVFNNLNKLHQVYVYFCIYKSIKSYIFFGFCAITHFFKGKVFFKSQITHFLLIEVMDYPPLVGVIFHNVHYVYIHGRNPCCP